MKVVSSFDYSSKISTYCMFQCTHFIQNTTKSPYVTKEENRERMLVLRPSQLYQLILGTWALFTSSEINYSGGFKDFSGGKFCNQNKSRRASKPMEIHKAVQQAHLKFKKQPKVKCKQHVCKQFLFQCFQSNDGSTSHLQEGLPKASFSKHSKNTDIQYHLGYTRASLIPWQNKSAIIPADFGHY